LSTIKNFINDESGATAIEYGLIVALIALGIVGALTTVGDNLTSTLDSASAGLTSATAD